MGPTISSTAETVPCARPPRAPEEAAEERNLDGVGLEWSNEWSRSKERDLNISKVIRGSPEMSGSGGGGGE